MSFLLVSSWIVTCSRPTRAKLFKNFYLLVKQGSIYDYRKLPMHPFPNPTFCPKCKRRVRGGLGDEFLKTLYWSSLYVSIFRELKLHAYGKRQTSQNRKWEDKTSSNSYYWLKITTNLCEEIMNSKQQVMGNLVTWYKFAFAVNVTLNLSFVKRFKTGRSVCKWWINFHVKHACIHDLQHESCRIISLGA